MTNLERQHKFRARRRGATVASFGSTSTSSASLSSWAFGGTPAAAGVAAATPTQPATKAIGASEQAS